MKKILIYSLICLSIYSCSSTDSDSELSVNEKKADVYYSQGTQNLIDKNYSQALNNLLKAKELNPSLSRIRTNLAMAYYFKQQPVFALQELNEALKIDPKNYDARLNLGTILMEQNKNKEAYENFNLVKASLTYEGMFRVYYNLALLNLKEGDRKSALLNLNQSLKEKSDYCPAHFKLGEMYSEELKFSDALESFQESMKGTCVTDPAPHYQVALALINLGRKEEARLKFSEIIDKFPKSNFKVLSEKKARELIYSKHSELESNTRQTEVINPQLPSNNIETPKF